MTQGRVSGAPRGLGFVFQVALDDLVLKLVRLGGEPADLPKIRQVDARADQAATVHQDAEAHHRQGAAGVTDQAEELIADPLGEMYGEHVL